MQPDSKFQHWIFSKPSLSATQLNDQDAKVFSKRWAFLLCSARFGWQEATEIKTKFRQRLETTPPRRWSPRSAPWGQTFPSGASFGSWENFRRRQTNERGWQKMLSENFASHCLSNFFCAPVASRDALHLKWSSDLSRSRVLCSNSNKKNWIFLLEHRHLVLVLSLDKLMALVNQKTFFKEKLVVLQTLTVY